MLRPDRVTNMLVGVIAVLLAILVLQPIMTVSPRRAAAIEYKVVQALPGDFNESLLNRLSREGWEASFMRMTTSAVSSHMCSFAGSSNHTVSVWPTAS